MVISVYISYLTIHVESSHPKGNSARKMKRERINAVVRLTIYIDAIKPNLIQRSLSLSVFQAVSGQL